MANAKELSKTVFVYDEDGYFEDTHIAQVNPRKPGSWLFPPRSTTVKPAMKPKFFYRIKDKGDQNSGWEEIPYPEKPEDFLGLEIPHQSRTQRNETLRRWLRKFVSDEPNLWREKHLDNDDGSLRAITIEEIPQPTEEDIKKQKESAVRSTRDYYLQLTDYLVVNDYPISAEEKQAVLAYRQALRDIPQAKSFPEEISLPEPPAVAKSAHKHWKSSQVMAEIQSKVKVVQDRADLTDQQKKVIIEALQKVSQQPGYPYEIEWPVEEEILKNQ